MLKLCFYVPESHLDSVKEAVFGAGAGKIGNYDHCCWQVKGQGQFRPLEGSKAFVGKAGTLERLEEYRVEIVLEDEDKSQVVEALINAHPYETPAYDLITIEN
jgi:hypothetical protein